MQTVDWNDWRHFLAISREGNLAAAARRLGVNHTTVYRRLNAMEARLGVRLFERLPAGYRLTEAGETLLPSAEQVEHEVTAAELRLAGKDLRPSGTLRVTTTEELMIGFLQPHLAAFQREQPNIQLEVSVGNLLFDLTRREADIAIRPTNKPPQHLIGRNLGAIGWAVYAAGSYLRRLGRPDQPADLARHHVVTFGEELANIGPSRWMSRHAGSQRIVLRSDSLLIQLGAVREGTGVALLPCFLGDGERRLQRLFGPFADKSAGCWLLTHPALRQVARVSTFLQFMTQAVAGDQARLAGT